jgi:arginase
VDIALLQVPYFLAQEECGMGRGPGRWIEAGAKEQLERLGHRVELHRVRPSRAEPEELNAVLELNRALAAQVRAAAQVGSAPLVLAGCCNSALGTLGALAGEDIGVIWFDAHGDFNTPATSPSGFLDGMGLSLCAGLCHREPLNRFGLLRPVAPARIAHIGGRDFDPGERDALERLGGQVVTASRLRQGRVEAELTPILNQLGSRVSEVYLHVDIDVLDPERYPANQFPAPGALMLEELIAALEMIGSRLQVRAAALTAYDPEYDPQGSTLAAGLQVLRTLATLLT